MSDDACSTCGGSGVVAHAELVCGPNLPPGGYYDSSDDTEGCPDCQKCEVSNRTPESDSGVAEATARSLEAQYRKLFPMTLIAAVEGKKQTTDIQWLRGAFAEIRAEVWKKAHAAIVPSGNSNLPHSRDDGDISYSFNERNFYAALIAVAATRDGVDLTNLPESR